MNSIYNPYWQQRISDTFQYALAAYPSVLMLRVDLRLPDGPASSDARVISRFIDSLKIRIELCQQHKRDEGKRVHTTTLRYIWAREFGEENGKKHYHVILLLNRYAWCSAGNYAAGSSLAGMIKQAWCSALRIDVQNHSTLAHFPESSALWINRGDAIQLQQGLERAAYLAKWRTKVTGDGERNFGCSRG